MKLFGNRVIKLAALNALILSGVSTFPSSLHAMEKIYFSTSDGEKFWCDRNNLEFHWDKSGRLAEICNLINDDEVDLGRIESKPHELDTNGKLFKKYVLDLIRRGEVSFKDKADTENTLRICEELGLPKAEEFICKLLKRKPRREMLKMDTMLTETRVSNTHFQTGDCPEGYVLVPGNESYNTPGSGEEFCVMKYAASAGAYGKAISQQGTLPWVDINRTNAASACGANGEDYHLITNAEWMTIARDIEATPENWSGGSVGTGTLSRGNSDSNAALASVTDEDPHHRTGATDWTHKRTHTLSNGEVIWDMAGNVWQWVADDLSTASDWWKEFSDLGRFPLASDNRSLYGPVGNYDSNHGTGKIFMYNGGAVLRGGSWHNATNAGVFAAALRYSATYLANNAGFRCAVPALGLR